MKTQIAALLTAAVTFIAASNANAQQTISHGEWRFGGHLSGLTIEDEIAEAERIDTGAFSIGFYTDYRKGSWISSLGFDFIFYDDNDEFSVLVEGDGIFNDGDISSESSDATALLISVATGYEFRFRQQQDFAVSLQGGYGYVTSSERSISNCSNCPTEDIEVDGGVFAKVTATKDFPGFAMGLYGQQFVTGDGLSTNYGITFSNKF